MPASFSVAVNPPFDLQLQMYASDPELTDAVADAFVTTYPTEKGYYSLLLWPEKLVPVVASAGLAGGFPKLITTDLTRGRIGHDWSLYAELAGRSAPTPPGGRWLFASHYVTALEMVRAGLGAALVPDFLVAREVGAGSLTLLDDVTISTNEDYYLCIKESRREEPALEALVRWFKSQISGPSTRTVKWVWRRSSGDRVDPMISRGGRRRKFTYQLAALEAVSGQDIIAAWMRRCRRPEFLPPSSRSRCY